VREEKGAEGNWTSFPRRREKGSRSGAVAAPPASAVGKPPRGEEEGRGGGSNGRGSKKKITLGVPAIATAVKKNALTRGRRGEEAACCPKEARATFLSVLKKNGKLSA